MNMCMFFTYSLFDRIKAADGGGRGDLLWQI